MFVDDGVMGFSEMRASVFAAVLLGRKDRRTVVGRRARRTTGCGPWGTAWEVRRARDAWPSPDRSEGPSSVEAEASPSKIV